MPSRRGRPGCSPTCPGGTRGSALRRTAPVSPHRARSATFSPTLDTREIPPLPSAKLGPDSPISPPPLMHTRASLRTCSPPSPEQVAASAPPPLPRPAAPPAGSPRALPPAGEQRAAARPRSPPAAGGAYLLQGRQQHQRQRRQDPRQRSRYPAHGGEEGRRRGGPRRSWSAAGARSGARGAARAEGGSGAGGSRGCALSPPARAGAAALAAACRSSSWAAMQREKRETERGGGWGKLGSGSGCFSLCRVPSAVQRVGREEEEEEEDGRTKGCEIRKK